MACTLAGNHVVAEFNARPREPVVIQGGLKALWRTVVERAMAIERPALLVPSGVIANNVPLRHFGGGGLLPDEFQVEHHEGMRGGGGVGYVGTVEGIHVFQCGLAPGRAKRWSPSKRRRTPPKPKRPIRSCPPYLAFLEKDMATNPGALTPFTSAELDALTDQLKAVSVRDDEILPAGARAYGGQTRRRLFGDRLRRCRPAGIIRGAVGRRGRGGLCVHTKYCIGLSDE